MPTTCVISFVDNPERVFYGGQLLNGTVRLNLTREKTVSGIYVEIYGEAYAHWTEPGFEDHNGQRESVTKSYTGKEDYLCERKHFVGGPNGRVDVRPGTYNYSFQCVIPAHSPTSVTGKYGWIRYGARVVLDYPFLPDKEFNESFTVIKNIDLNAVPELRTPVVSEKVKTFKPCGFLCCWKSGPLRITARSPVGGYTPGQTINLNVTVNNESNEKITHVEARLVKETTFHAQLDNYVQRDQRETPLHARLNGYGQQHQKKTRDYIASVDGIGCDVNQNKEMHLNLRVPSTSPTDCSTSNIILVKYYIEVIANAEGCCSRNLTVHCPITIGTYPIQDNVSRQPIPTQILSAQEFSSVAQMPGSSDVFVKMPYPDNPTGPTAPPQSDMTKDPKYDPPTYEEVMGDNENADNDFKPKYPMFKRSTSYSNGN